MNKFSQTISVIFHPILLPTWMMIILLVTGVGKSQPQLEWFYFVMTFVNSFVIPAVILLLMKRWKVISSLTMEKREDRLGPIAIMAMFLYVTNKFFAGISSFSIFSFYLTCSMMLCIIAFCINLFWKVSLHTLGWGGFVACLFVMTTASAKIYLPYFLVSIILTGVVASSRMILKSHNAAQIYSGFGIGFLFVFVLYVILLV